MDLDKIGNQHRGIETCKILGPNSKDLSWTDLGTEGIG